MSQPNIDVNIDETAHAAKRFEPTTDQIQETLSELSYVRYNQTESKWSPRTAPTSFGKRYAECMQENLDDLESLQRQLDTFIVEVRKALRCLEDTESDHEAAALLAEKRLDGLADARKEPASNEDDYAGGFVTGRQSNDAAVAEFIRGLHGPI